MRKKLALTCVLFLCLSVWQAVCSCTAADKDKIRSLILDPTVTVHTDTGQGTGSVVVHNNVSYVLTAAHVVDSNVRVRHEGGKREVETTDVNIVKVLAEEGEEIGETKLRAKIIVFDAKEDVALLRVVSRKPWFSSIQAASQSRIIPGVGEQVYHCGSLFGQEGYPESLTFGIISQVGRVIQGIGRGLVFDQTTATAVPGSSGGGVFYADDCTYLGMVTLGSGETMSAFVPLRRIVKVLGEWGYAKILGYGSADSEKPKTMNDAVIIEGDISVFAGFSHPIIRKPASPHR